MIGLWGARAMVAGLLLAALCTGCHSAYPRYFYNNTGRAITIEFVRRPEYTTKHIVNAQRSASAGGLYYQATPCIVESGDERWFYRSLAPPERLFADLGRALLSIVYRIPLQYQIESDGTIYRVGAWADFPVREFPPQPRGFPKRPRPVPDVIRKKGSGP